MGGVSLPHCWVVVVVVVVVLLLLRRLLSPPSSPTLTQTLHVGP